MRSFSYSIFLVDDDEVYLKALKEYLKQNLGFNVAVFTFSIGEECLQHMNMKPDVIILDYFLNSTEQTAANGLDILKKIKIMNSRAQIIMLSNQDNMDVAANAMKYGAFDYVSKNERAFLKIHNAITGIVSINEMMIQGSEVNMAHFHTEVKPSRTH